MSPAKKSLSLAILSLSLACSGNTKFKGAPDSGTAKGAANVEPTPKPILQASLDLMVPSHEIRAGKRTLQTMVMLENAEMKDVVWKVEGVDAGSIDTKGLYTSPEALTTETEVVITASLKSDPSVTDSETITVIPAETIFVGCTAGSLVFPIQADVYRLPRNTERLPDFATIGEDKLSTVCMDQYNVPERSFTEGFPGVENLYEWFALHTTGKLVIREAGTYTFRINSDDGSKLSIDGQLVVDNDGLHSPQARDGSVYLNAGTHDFVLDYYQGPADRIALELFWQTPGASDFVLVPTEAFQK